MSETVGDTHVAGDKSDEVAMMLARSLYGVMVESAHFTDDRNIACSLKLPIGKIAFEVKV